MPRSELCVVAVGKKKPQRVEKSKNSQIAMWSFPLTATTRREASVKVPKGSCSYTIGEGEVCKVQFSGLWVSTSQLLNTQLF